MDEKELEQEKTADAAEEAEALEQERTADMEEEAFEETMEVELEEEAVEMEAEAEAEPEEGEAEPKESKESKESKKEAKKKKKEKKDKKDEQIEELTDRVRRTMAEFDNYRKRVEKEKSHMYEIGAKDVIEKILPVVDNFQRGFDSLSDEEREAPFAMGMDKVFKQMMDMLEGIGVKPIEALNQEFDPNLHNAVMHVEDESVGENIIVEEFQKGYCYRDSVVRHSMVKVAN